MTDGTHDWQNPASDANKQQIITELWPKELPDLWYDLGAESHDLALAELDQIGSIFSADPRNLELHRDKHALPGHRLLRVKSPEKLVFRLNIRGRDYHLLAIGDYRDDPKTHYSFLEQWELATFKAGAHVRFKQEYNKPFIHIAGRPPMWPMVGMGRDPTVVDMVVVKTHFQTSGARAAAIQKAIEQYPDVALLLLFERKWPFLIEPDRAQFVEVEVTYEHGASTIKIPAIMLEPA